MVKIVELPPDAPTAPTAPNEPGAAQNGQQQQQQPAEQENADDDRPSLARLRHWIEEENGALQRYLSSLGGGFGISKWTTFWIASFVCAAIMVRPPNLAPLLSHALSAGTYAMDGTLKALANQRWDDSCSWMLYWLVYQGVTMLDFLANWFSWYYPIKTAFMAYFHLPPLLGAQHLRRRWIDPVIYQGPGMDTILKRASPWLLKHVYDLDTVALGAMQEEELRRYVYQKRSDYWQRLLGNTPAQNQQ